jgi:hypothetical protein
MSCSLPPLDRIASAAVVFCGHYGDVTRLAQQRGCCRQAVYRQADAALDDLDHLRHYQESLRLRQQVDLLQARCDDLQRRFDGALVFEEDRQAEFAAVAQSEGVSLPVARRLLQVVLRERTPSVAKLGRWTKAAGQCCGALLEVVDEFTRPLVRHALADEIFVRHKPILMLAEPHSLCWISGRLADHRDGATWAEELAQLPALEQLTKDAGTGLASGLEQVNQQRQKKDLPAIPEQDDHFHVLREGRRALYKVQREAARTLKVAEKAAKKERRRRRQKHAGKRSGHASVVALRWRQAERAFDGWVQQERAWQQVEAACKLFDDKGSLRTRAQAEAAVAAALPELPGKHWAKVRRLLARPQLWTCLDRAHEQLAALPVAAELRQAAMRVEGLRRRPEALGADGPSAGALRGVLLAASVVLSLAGAAGTAALAGVRGVLSGVWRASSLIEGINSVLRMQQARHRRLTPGLLNLKRLYWNCHPFRTGKRRKQSPYERLGLRLPPVSWWELLQWSPEELRRYLSESKSTSGPSALCGEASSREGVQQLSAPGVVP